MNKKKINKTKEFKIDPGVNDYYELEDIVKEIMKLRSEMDVTSIFLDTENVYGYYDYNDIYIVITVHYVEEETDEAYNERMEKERQEKEAKVALEKMKKEKRGAAKQLLKLGETNSIVEDLLKTSGVEEYLRSKYSISEKTIL